MIRKSFFDMMAFLMIIVLCFGTASCSNSDDNKDANIDTSPISVLSGKDRIIEGADTIESTNEFIAYGNGNKVHGWHVGEALLQVNRKHTIHLTVMPVYTLYDDPICNWDCSQAYVKSNQRQGYISDKSTRNELIYENAGGASFLLYKFEGDRLKSIGAIVSTNYTSNYASYLAERYLMLPYYYGADTYFIGIDALKMDLAQTVVVMSIYNINYLMTIYMPAADYSGSTRSIEDPSYWKRELEKMIKILNL